jgi:predicted aspartyl protease
VLRSTCVFAALMVAAVGTGCAGSDAEPGATQARQEKTTTTAESGNDARKVDLNVDSGSWGVFALADVFIDGQGPFTFSVDTGASSSVVDWDLVKKLRIKTIGKPLQVTGITCRGQAARIEMSDWRVGEVALPAGEIQAIDMPDAVGAVDGLLGSDVLSSFGSITVDYEAERLLLASDS